MMLSEQKVVFLGQEHVLEKEPMVLKRLIRLPLGAPWTPINKLYKLVNCVQDVGA